MTTPKYHVGQKMIVTSARAVHYGKTFYIQEIKYTHTWNRDGSRNFDAVLYIADLPPTMPGMRAIGYVEGAIRPAPDDDVEAPDWNAIAGVEPTCA